MKKLIVFGLSLAMLAVSAGCAHSQQPPLNPVYTCPTPVFAATGATYTPLNPSTSTTNPPVQALTYKVTTPGINQYCFVAQSYDSVGNQISGPSNVTTVAVTTAAQSVTLNWSAPASCGASTVANCKYVLSVALATLQAAPLAPALNTPTAAELIKPNVGKPSPEDLAKLKMTPKELVAKLSTY